MRHPAELEVEAMRLDALAVEQGDTLEPGASIDLHRDASDLRMRAWRLRKAARRRALLRLVAAGQAEGGQ